MVRTISVFTRWTSREIEHKIVHCIHLQRTGKAENAPPLPFTQSRGNTIGKKPQVHVLHEDNLKTDTAHT